MTEKFGETPKIYFKFENVWLDFFWKKAELLAKKMETDYAHVALQLTSPFTSRKN